MYVTFDWIKEGIFEAKLLFHFSSFLWHLLKVFISQSRITAHRGKTTNLSVSPKTWASAFESIAKVKRNEFYKCSVGRDKFQITNDKFFHSTDIKINCCPTDVEIGNRNTRFCLHQYGFFDLQLSNMYYCSTARPRCRRCWLTPNSTFRFEYLSIHSPTTDSMTPRLMIERESWRWRFLYICV